MIQPKQKKNTEYVKTLPTLSLNCVESGFFKKNWLKFANALTCT